MRAKLGPMFGVEADPPVWQRSTRDAESRVDVMRPVPEDR
jgi:hypothetical protein